MVKIDQFQKSKKQKKLPIPVISIGSITVGGAGKSPVTAYIANKLLEQGIKTAILTRGYKRKSSGQVIVSDGQDIICQDAAISGDEPLMLARQLGGKAIIIADSNRYAGGQKAIELGAQIAILDDGAQHTRLARDLDIILLNSQKPMGNGFMLPAGPLRDLPQRIQQADLLWLSGREQTNNVNIYQNIKAINARPEPGNPYLAFSGQTVSLEGLKIGAFCGLARPENFFNSLKSLNPKDLITFAFDDHHAYTKTDLGTIISNAEKAGVQYVVTTEKDLAKISADLWSGNIPLCVLPLVIKVEDDKNLSNLLSIILKGVPHG